MGVCSSSAVLIVDTNGSSSSYSLLSRFMRPYDTQHTHMILFRAKGSLHRLVKYDLTLCVLKAIHPKPKELYYFQSKYRIQCLQRSCFNFLGLMLYSSASGMSKYNQRIVLGSHKAIIARLGKKQGKRRHLLQVNFTCVRNNSKSIRQFL